MNEEVLLSGVKIRRVRSIILNQGSKRKKVKSRIKDPLFRIKNPQSRIKDPLSRILNPSSGPLILSLRGTCPQSKITMQEEELKDPDTVSLVYNKRMNPEL